MIELAHSLLMECFNPSCNDSRFCPHEFYRTRFLPEAVLYRLPKIIEPSLLEKIATLVRQLLASAVGSYADETERLRIVRELIIPELAGVGIEVTGVPPRDAIRERYYGGH